ncbi:MAG: serine hydrolase [Microscillaceae bacterium]|jgi:CubicO group peptidase (beta-lactamase class C family)|nr:serine hydrolase [Microscillaceae bacterium]
MTKKETRNQKLENYPMKNLFSCIFISLAFIYSPQIFAQMIPQTIQEAIVRRVNSGYCEGIALAVFENGKTEYFNAGYLNQSQKRKIDANTVFEIGSISKTFTALLLAQAIQKGQIGLDDPIQKYLPKDVVLPTQGDKQITFRHLATHTSGLPRLPTNLPTDSDDPYAQYDKNQMYAFLKKCKLKGKIGEKYEYSNLGVGLLGLILAEINQTTYPNLLNDWIFKPLQMAHSQTIVEFPKDFDNIATPHLGGQAVKMWSFDALAGAGAIKCSVDDLLKYLKIQMGIGNKKLAEIAQTTHNEQFKIDENSRIALGWHLQKNAEQTYIWHNGGTMGSHSFMGFDAQKQKGVVVLCNSADEIDELGWSLLTGKIDLKPRKTAIKLPADVLKNYEGKYDFGGGFIITVFVAGENLMAQATNQDAFRIFAESETKFFYTVVEAELEFLKDSAGVVKELILQQEGQSAKGVKMK